MWNTVLFDLDGTLTDSGEGITKSVQYALKEGFGIEAELEDLRQFVGPPLLEKLESYAKLSKDEAREAIRWFRKRYDTIGIFENRLYPGIEDLLAQLKQEGMTICLSSSKPEFQCRRILEHFHILQYFDEMVGAKDDETRSDKAEVVEEVIRRLKEHGKYSGKESLVIVGDRNYDIVGGKKNGIGTIGVSYGYGSRKELEEAWPDAIADSVRELRNILIGQYRDGKDHPTSSKNEEERHQSIPAEGPSGREPEESTQHESAQPEEKDLQEAYLTGRREKQYNWYTDMSVGRKIFRAILPVLIGLGINLGISIVYAAVVMGLYGGMDPRTEQSELLMTGIVDLAILIIMVVMWHRDEALRKGFHAADQMMVKRHMNFSLFAVDICFVLGVTLLFNLVFSRFIPTSSQYEGFVDSFDSIPYPLAVALIGVLGPCAEEFLFRGVFFRRVRDCLNVYAAALLSGLAFAVFHGNLEQGIPAFVMGFLFCLVYEHFGTMAAPIAGHMSVNLLALIEDKVVNVSGSPSGTANTVFGVIVMVVIVAGIASGVWIFTQDKKVNRI